jgi:hypothetical protein
VEEEDRKWVLEILKWVIVARTDLSIVELQEGVEESLDDHLPGFERFLEVECGSLLHLLPGKK